MMAAWIGPAIVAAFISAVVTGLGWYVGHAQDLRRDATADRTYSRYPDGVTRGDQGEPTPIDGYGPCPTRRDHRARDPRYAPFVPSEIPPFVFDTLVPDIHILPHDIIDAVMLYYRQIASIASFAEDLRSDMFKSLDARRKVAMHGDYIALQIHARYLADTAVELISASLDGTGDQ